MRVLGDIIAESETVPAFESVLRKRSGGGSSRGGTDRSDSSTQGARSAWADAAAPPAAAASYPPAGPVDASVSAAGLGLATSYPPRGLNLGFTEEDIEVETVRRPAPKDSLAHLMARPRRVDRSEDF
jgi:hypothetical protein